VDSVPRSTDTAQYDQAPGQVPSNSDRLRELGSWLESLAGVLDRMPQVQRRALLGAADAMRGDLSAIRLACPEVTR
jgi:hypothetical protein